MLIQADKLSIGYRFALQNGLQFELSEGEVLSISGPNGSGKTTLLKTILGQVAPLYGKVVLNFKKANIRYLPQTIQDDLPLSITMGEILEAFDVSQEVMGLVSPGFLQKRWCEASGGEKQKVLILSRLGGDCSVLILDEPFNHLDRLAIGHLIEFLCDLVASKYVKALITVSHIRVTYPADQPVKELSLQ